MKAEMEMETEVGLGLIDLGHYKQEQLELEQIGYLTWTVEANQLVSEGE